MIHITPENFEASLIEAAAIMQRGEVCQLNATALTPDEKKEFMTALRDFFGDAIAGNAFTPHGDLDLNTVFQQMDAEDAASAQAEEEAADEAVVADAFGKDVALMLEIEHAKVKAALQTVDELAPDDLVDGMKEDLLYEALQTTAQKAVSTTLKAGHVSANFASARAAKASFAKFSQALDAGDNNYVEPGQRPIEASLYGFGPLGPTGPVGPGGHAEVALPEPTSNAFAPTRGCGEGWIGPVPAGDESEAAGAAAAAVQETAEQVKALFENERACASVVDYLDPETYAHAEGFSAIGRAEDLAAKGQSEADKTMIRALYHASNNLKLRLNEIEFDTAQEKFGFVCAIDEVTALLDKVTE